MEAKIKTEHTNRVEVMGKFVNYFVTQYGYNMMTVSVQRYDHNKSTLAYITFEVKKDILITLRPGSYVHIIGHVYAFDYKSEATDSIQHVQRFVIDSISPAKTELEEVFGIPGRFIPNQYAHYYVLGVYEGIQLMKNTSFWSLKIRTSIAKYGQDNIVLVNDSCFNQHMSPKVLNAGEIICCACSIITPEKKRISGKYYENIVLEDIARVPVVQEAELASSVIENIDTFFED